VVTLLALAGCGGSSSTHTPSSLPTSLVIVRTVPRDVQGPPQNFPQLNETVTDSRAVQAFYTRTLALPHPPSSTGPTNGCNNDGVKYFLIFYGGEGHGDTVDLYAKLTTGTCPTLELTNVDAQVSMDGRQPDQAYFDALAGLLGISPTQIRPPTIGGTPRQA
jgi:hypothetical protein